MEESGFNPSLADSGSPLVCFLLSFLKVEAGGGLRQRRRKVSPELPQGAQSVGCRWHHLANSHFH